MSVSTNISRCHQVKNNHHQQSPVLIRLVTDLNNSHSDFCFKIHRDENGEFQAIRKKLIRSENRNQRCDDYYHLHGFNAKIGHMVVNMPVQTHTHILHIKCYPHCEGLRDRVNCDQTVRFSGRPLQSG